MELKLITPTACPHCRAHVVAESCESVHCNGQGNERRRFACDHELRWSPNFGRLEVVRRCPRDPAEVAHRGRRAAARAALGTFLAALDVDDEWKARVTAYLPGP